MLMGHRPTHPCPLPRGLRRGESSGAQKRCRHTQATAAASYLAAPGPRPARPAPRRPSPCLLCPPGLLWGGQSGGHSARHAGPGSRHGETSCAAAALGSAPRRAGLRQSRVRPRVQREFSDVPAPCGPSTTPAPSGEGAFCCRGEPRTEGRVSGAVGLALTGRPGLLPGLGGPGPRVGSPRRTPGIPPPFFVVGFEFSSICVSGKGPCVLSAECGSGGFGGKPRLLNSADQPAGRVWVWPCWASAAPSASATCQSSGRPCGGHRQGRGPRVPRGSPPSRPHGGDTSVVGGHRTCEVPGVAVAGPPGLTSGSGVSQLPGGTTISGGAPRARVANGPRGPGGAWGARRSRPPDGSRRQRLPQVSGQLCDLLFGNRSARLPGEGRPERAVQSVGQRHGLSEGAGCPRTAVAAQSLVTNAVYSPVLGGKRVLGGPERCPQRGQRRPLGPPQPKGQDFVSLVTILFSGHSGQPHLRAAKLRPRAPGGWEGGGAWRGRGHSPLIRPPHSSRMRCSLASLPWNSARSRSAHGGRPAPPPRPPAHTPKEGDVPGSRASR